MTDKKESITNQVEFLAKAGWEVSARLNAVLEHLRGPAPQKDSEGKPHSGLTDVLHSARGAASCSLMALVELEDLLGTYPNAEVASHQNEVVVARVKGARLTKTNGRTLS